MTDHGGGDDDADGDGFPISRRWLIRLLVGLGIGIPVAIEGATFAELVRERLFGGDGDGDGTATATTTTPEGAGVGDEVLPETAPTERVTSARVDAGGEQWRLVLTIQVENTTDAEYELRLGAVTTSDGATVEEETTTGRIPPGETAFVSGAWALPAGATPASVSATAIAYGEGTERREYDIALGRIPVER